MPTIQRATGTDEQVKVTFSHISPDAMEARDNWPAALRVVYECETGSLTLAAPLDDSCAGKLHGFIKPHDGEIPTGEARLKAFLEKGLVREEIWASTYGNFIKQRLAPVGKYPFQLYEVRRFIRKRDSNDRIGFTVSTKEGMKTGFSAPWPEIGGVRGDTPDKDEFNINDKTMGYRYLASLGLDLDRWEPEMQKAEALWPRPGVTSMFADEHNPCPEILQEVERQGAEHGIQWVQIEIEDDPQYGLGPCREGAHHEVVMRIYATDDAPQPSKPEFEAANEEPRSDFSDELTYFVTLYDSLTKLLHDGQFTVNGLLTDDGRKIAVSILVPVVAEFPQIVRGTKEDGSPALTFPITKEGWTLDGLHWMAELASRLMVKNDLAGIKTIVATDMVEWAKANVPELSAEPEVL